MAVRFTMKTAAAKTGLSSHVIRAWERRYGALSPDRTDTNRRLYSEEEVERLKLLQAAVKNGNSISQVANLSNDELRKFGSRERSNDPRLDVFDAQDSVSLLTSSLIAVENIDSEALEIVLIRATALLGTIGLVDSVVIPLLETIGRRWEDGSLSVGQEHMASAALRTHLDRIRHSITPPDPAPKILITTPSGQSHELGALVAAISAGIEGWQAVYLGPNLPSSEISRAASRVGVQAVGLSLIYPAGDPAAINSLKQLRQELGPDMPILVGGRAASSYIEVFQEINARPMTDLLSFRTELEIIKGSFNRAPASLR